MSPRGFFVHRQGGVFVSRGDMYRVTEAGDEGDVFTSHDGALPTFEPPSGGGGPHTHPESDIVGLVADLAAKAPTVHTHPQGDITNLVADLAAKAATTQAVDTFGAPSDITTHNASTSAHGFVPKLPNDATKYFDGVGGFTVPAGGGGGASPWDVEIVKAVDEDVVASTVLQDDDELFFNVVSGEVWRIECVAVYAGAATATDMKLTLTFPSARGLVRSLTLTAAEAVSGAEQRVTAATSITTLVVGTRSSITAYEVALIELLLVFSATGAVTVQHANQVSGTTRMAAGSILRGKKVV
jgi:hypothetical protein